MPAAIVRADCDRLTTSANNSGWEAAAVRQALQDIERQTETIQAGDWMGPRAQAFHDEMNGQMLPTLDRLVRALEAAADTTRQVNQIAQQAEAEAASYLKATGNGSGPGAALGAAAAVVGMTLHAPCSVWRMRSRLAAPAGFCRRATCGRGRP